MAVFKFLNKYLKNDPQAPVADRRFETIPGKELRVFPTDADLPKDILNGKIDESFVPAAQVMLPEEGKFAPWKEELLEQLRKRVLRAMLRDLDVPDRHFMEDGYLVGKGTSLPLLYMEQDDFSKIPDYKVFARHFQRNTNGALVYFPRIFPVALAKDQSWDMTASYSWTKKSPPNYVERSHLLLGHTTDERKLHFLLANVKRLAKLEGSLKWDGRVVGQGQAGIIAAYAALFEPSIKEVILIDPPATHKNGPHFLNVLRVLDIPEALGLLAPAPLTIIGGNGPAFDRTAEIYRLAGAGDKLKRK